MKTTGNTILITGATSGIGLAMATRFADQSNTVIAVGRNQAQLDELAAWSPLIHPVAADLTNADDRERLVRLVEERFPSLNVLINNAGVQYNYTFAESREQPDRIT